jgi:hypothetical protein
MIIPVFFDQVRVFFGFFPRCIAVLLLETLRAFLSARQRSTVMISHSPPSSAA